MGLKIESVHNRLSTLLKFHQKLVVENRDKRQMVRAERRIKHLIWLLEKYNSKGIVRPSLDD